MEELKNKKLVFHVHTKHSFDSSLEPKATIDLLLKNEIEGVIITDHNTIEGAVEAKEYTEMHDYKFLVVVGEEIETDIGDIIGFPLKKEIKSGKYLKVIQEIKRQGGFVVLPHPYESHNLSKINQKNFLNKMDFIEIFNSRLNSELNGFAEELAEKNNMKKLIGSDAHFGGEILNTFLKFNNKFEIVDSKKNLSEKRYVRRSQIIKNIRNKNIVATIKYVILYFLNK